MGTAAKSLSDALSFQAPEVVLRFQREQGLSRPECEELFLECKRWLWACARRDEDHEAGKDVPRMLLISPELELIDEMWHCFLMFTREYTAFCHDYLGRVIHHVPMTSHELLSFESVRATDPERAKKIRQDEIRPQLGYLYDLLGPETLRRWYQRGQAT